MMITEVPNPLSEEFAPFRSEVGEPLWRGLKLIGQSELEWAAVGVRIEACQVDNVHWNAKCLNLERCKINGWQIIDSQVVAPRFAGCEFLDFTLDRAQFSWACYTECRLQRFAALNAVIEGSTFEECDLDSIYIGERTKTYKLRFVRSRISGIVDVRTFPVGVITLNECTGSMVFGPDSVPSRIILRDSFVTLFFITEPNAFWQVRTGRIPTGKRKMEAAWNILEQNSGTYQGALRVEVPQNASLSHDEIVRAVELDRRTRQSS